jgi:cation:H+ antiporter
VGRLRGRDRRCDRVTARVAVRLTFVVAAVAIWLDRRAGGNGGSTIGRRLAHPRAADAMSGLGSPILVLIFLAGAGTTWMAGILLSKATDALDSRLGLGDALGGLVLLSIAGSLPELAITISAAAAGNLKLAAGNLIGGIAIQTMVLLICDFAVGPVRPLTYLVGRLTPVLEGLLVIILVAGVEMGALLKPSTAIAGRVSPASIGIVVIWIIGLYVINQASKGPRWSVTFPGSQPGRRRRERAKPEQPHPFSSLSTARIAALFGLASAVTLAAGVALEESGNELANRLSLNGVIFGATVLAFATALPEISSGIAAVRLGDHALAMGDILGGNAFQVCLFLVADLVAGKPVLPSSGNLNAWLAALGVALTAIYGFGVIIRPTRCRVRLGPDSLLALALFSLGIAGLFFVRPG